MTMIDPDQSDQENGRILKRRTLRQLIDDGPPIVVLRRTPKGKLEVYVYSCGQRLSLIPKSPQELYDWLNHYCDSPLRGLKELGLQLPDGPRKKERRKRRRK